MLGACAEKENAGCGVERGRTIDDNPVEMLEPQ